MLVSEWMGDRNVTFLETTRKSSTNPAAGKKFAESHIQTQTEGNPTCWSFVRSGSRGHKRKFPLNVKRSCIFFLKTTKRWSKMIIKGGSQMMRHVPRTHRVASDWLFDRINMDSQIQIRHIDTKKPTRRHAEQRKFSHVMNGDHGSFFPIQKHSQMVFLTSWCPVQIFIREETTGSSMF